MKWVKARNGITKLINDKKQVLGYTEYSIAGFIEGFRRVGVTEQYISMGKFFNIRFAKESVMREVCMLNGKITEVE